MSLYYHCRCMLLLYNNKRQFYYFTVYSLLYIVCHCAIYRAREIVLEDVGYGTFLLVLQFVYCDEVDIDVDTAMDLFQVGLYTVVVVVVVGGGTGGVIMVIIVVIVVVGRVVGVVVGGYLLLL